MSKNKKTSTDKDLEAVIGNIGELGDMTVTVTTKYLSSLEKKGAIVNGKPVPHKDFIKKEGFDKLTSSERSYLYYLREKETIREAYQNSKNWDEVISSVVYIDSYESMEAFIDLVEETYNTSVKNVEHLKKLTGCKEYKETEKVKLQEVIYSARYSKYYRTLKNAVENGLKYNQLLKLKPEMYGLPNTWKTWRELNQYKALLNAIDEEFSIGEPNISLLPNLRLVAKELEAPYSVIMDAYKYTRTTNKLTFKQQRKEIGNKVRVKFPEFIKAKGKAWRKDWLLEDTEVYDIAREDIETDYVLALSQVVLKDITGEEAKCGAEIEADIREYFNEELEDLKELIVNKTNGDTGYKKEVYRAES